MPLTLSIPITVPCTLDSTVQEYSKEVVVSKVGFNGFNPLSCLKSNSLPINSHSLNSLNPPSVSPNQFIIKASIPRMAYSCEDIVPLSFEISSSSPSGFIIDKVSLKQQIQFGHSSRKKTQRVHILNYTEVILAPKSFSTHVSRCIHFPIPNTPIMNGDMHSSLLNITHLLQFTVKSLKPWSRRVKVNVPLVVGGFPFMLFDQMLVRTSLDTLPVYLNSEAEVNQRLEGEERHVIREITV